MFRVPIGSASDVDQCRKIYLTRRSVLRSIREIDSGVAFVAK